MFLDPSPGDSGESPSYLKGPQQQPPEEQGSHSPQDFSL